MPGISPIVLAKTRDAILNCCDSIYEFRELIQIFNDQRIYPWKDKIHRSNAPLNQAELLIGALYNQYRSDTGENALVLFITVLAERYDRDTKCHSLLIKLASEIDTDINRPREAFPKTIQKEYINSRIESLRKKEKPNYLDKIFLTRGLEAAKSVCRLEWHKRGAGTGFLVADDLVLTSYHVVNIDNCTNSHSRLGQCDLRFGPTKLDDGTISAGDLLVKLDRANPLVLYSPVDNLDFALLKLDKPINNSQLINIAKFSLKRLNIGEPANIVHYPLGGPKQFSLRNNEIIDIEDIRFYYLADTEEGSSGSPVFNDDWNVIGIHRAGNLLDPGGTEQISDGNQGVPVSLIVDRIQKYITISQEET